MCLHTTSACLDNMHKKLSQIQERAFPEEAVFFTYGTHGPFIAFCANEISLTPRYAIYISPAIPKDGRIIRNASCARQVKDFEAIAGLVAGRSSRFESLVSPDLCRKGPKLRCRLSEAGCAGAIGAVGATEAVPSGQPIVPPKSCMR